MAVDTRDVIRIDDDGGVRLVTFDRPEALNAFNQPLWLAVTEALEEAAGDESISCVVLTGEGRAFTAGMDLGELADPSRDEEPGYTRFMPVVEEFPKPLVAAVNGVAVGIGATVLPHCDVALVSESARLKMPFISLGVTTEGAASYLLPATVGWQRAAHLLYTEPWISAEEAVEMGLALRVCEPDRLLDEAMGLARHIATLPLGPLMATKRLLLAARLDAVRAARARELAEFEPLVRAMIGGS